MYFYTKTTFEFLPDEMILEICRYLHCSHVLYSFFDLNSRLNRTIASFCHHVWFRRATYKQLLYIYEHILPRIGSSVTSLTIHPLHQASFPISYKQQIFKLVPHLKTLTLTSWRSDYLVLAMMETLQEMHSLEKLIIQELSCSTTLPDIQLLEQIFSLQNKYLTNIIFDYDCDPFHLNNPSMNHSLSNHIDSLTIQLDTLNDLAILIQFIPHIHRLDVTIKNSSLESVPFPSTLPLLKELSIWSIHWYSHFIDMIPLLSIAPSLEQLSLTISTRDADLIDGEKLRSILPVHLKQFNYTVCYHRHGCFEQFNIDRLKNSWQSIPVIYSISEVDKRMFLHTLPYSSSRLMIRSSLAKSIPANDFYQMYSKVDQIQVYTMNNLSDVFPIVGQCHRVRELTLLTANEPAVLPSAGKSNFTGWTYYSAHSFKTLHLNGIVMFPLHPG